MVGNQGTVSMSKNEGKMMLVAVIVGAALGLLLSWISGPVAVGP